VLRQLNDVAVKIPIASASTPGLRAWFVEDVSTRTYRDLVRSFDVDDGQCDLRTRGRLLLRRIEGKMKVGTLSPGDFCVVLTRSSAHI